LNTFKSSISGAFIALDVFFVISGYLITKGILKKLHTKEFSYKEFYLKRLKRLFPILFLTLSMTFTIGYYLYPPGRLMDLSLTSIFSLIPASNIYFATTTDYFSYKAHTLPLLHTWSLSLEEQFYLIYPISLIFAIRLLPKKVLGIILISISIISIFWAQDLIDKGSTSVYYLLQFRLFELLLGASLNWIPYSKKRLFKFNEVLSFLGFGIIASGIIFFNIKDGFPGINAILPAIGTFMVLLFSGHTKLFKSIFSIAPLRIIGASSYSIYLLHWPIFVLLRFYLLRNLYLSEYLALITIITLMGCLTWKFIEVPFMTIKHNSSKEKHFLYSALFLSISFSFVLLNTYTNNGFPDRESLVVKKSRAENVKDRNIYWKYIEDITKNKIQENTRNNVLFIGNSHATDLIYMFTENQALFTPLLVKTTYRCHHFVFPINPRDKGFCNDIKKKIKNSKELQRSKRVYLHDYWYRFDSVKLDKFLLELRQKTRSPIYLFGPKASYRHSLIDVVHIAKVRGISAQGFAKKDEMSKRVQYAKEANLYYSTKKWKDLNIYFVDLMSIQCQDDYSRCPIFDKKTGELLYFDDTHFNLKGAKDLGFKLKEALPSLFDLSSP
jgi:peptidoglycan/LPS O-acetylase OafA/YrhL